MKKRKIAILFGGKSGEHEVSLISGASVFTHIDTNLFDPLLIGIDYDGRWHLQEPPLLDPEQKRLILRSENTPIVSVRPGEGLWAGEKLLDIDAVFPVLHGTFGEDGTIQGLLETAHVPYVGAGVLGSSLGMDKGVVKKIWFHEGLPAVPFVEFSRHEFLMESGPNLIARRVENRFSYPVFVKPARSGSSVGVSRVDHREELSEALAAAFRFDTKALIEPRIRGREVECSVIGNETAEAFAVGEIIPRHCFYDYEAKYIDPQGADLKVPADIGEELTEKVRNIARKAYRAAEAEGFARIDFFIREDGEVLLNEINTIPGFTHISMFPKLCAEMGLEYADLITHLIELGLKRFSIRNALHYRRE
jgi:D-alanine-D-alanine ligase